MKLIPLADRVVLKKMEAEETTKSGFILGPGGMVDGKEITMSVKPGDKVLTEKYGGSTVKVDGEEYLVVRQSEIIAIVE